MKKMILMVAWMLGTLSAVYAGNVDTEAKILSSWDFKKPEVRKEWISKIHSLKVLPSSDTFKLEIIGQDPYIFSPMKTGGFSVTGFGYISVKMKCTHTVRTFNEVYWIIPSQLKWDMKKREAFGVKAVKPNEFHVFNFKLSGNPLWTNVIEQFRLDLFNNAPKGSIIEIEWIKISRQALK